MRRGFFIPIVILFITIFSLIVVPQVAAFDIPGLPNTDKFDQGSQMDKDLQEFCDRRSGDQMNLETWYSGKCKDKSGNILDSYSGEGVGFSSIVILDLAEKISGKKDKNQTFLKTIQDLSSFIQKGISEGKNPNEIKLALQQKTTEAFLNNDNGIFGGISKTLAFLITNPPASTRSYIAYVSQNLKDHHIIPSAYAANPQGIGYATFAVFLPLWKATRNISYILFTMVFILYGFMMMFRVNINPKTVITVQLAIPKLIFTLLIITFSYAIVGLVMDLMYVIFYLFLSILASQNLIYNGNLFVTAASGQYGGFLSGLINMLAASVIAAPIGIINFIIGGPSVLSGVLGIGLAFLGGIGLILGLIIILAVLISYVKLIWKLIQAFLEVIISLIIAPFRLLANAFPGSDTFGSWMRSIIANMSVFPITMMLLTVSYMLMVQPAVNLCGTYNPGSAPQNTNVCEWIFGVKSLNPGGYVPYIPFVTPPLGNAPDALMALFGLALLLMASKYVDIVKDALKVPPFKYGTAIGEPLQFGYNTVKSGYEALKKQSSIPSGGGPAPAPTVSPTAPTPPAPPTPSSSPTP